MYFRVVLGLFVVVSFVFAIDTQRLNHTIQTTPNTYKLEAISAYFVGLPYGYSPLGEGRGVDSDPRFRLDRFDCTTFVETMTALSLSPNITKAKQRLDYIRYDGKVGFGHRRHLPALMWKAQLVDVGVYVDITKDIKDHETITKKPNPKLLPKDMRYLAKDLQKSYVIDYIPLHKIAKNIEYIPSGVVVNVVREDRADKFLVITHQMLLFKTHGKIYFRHASNYRKPKVVDESLGSFVSRVSKYKWRVAGINILKINFDNEPTQRRKETE